MQSVVRICVIAQMPHLPEEQRIIFEEELNEKIEGFVLSFGGEVESIEHADLTWGDNDPTTCPRCGDEENGEPCAC